MNITRALILLTALMLFSSLFCQAADFRLEHLIKIGSEEDGQIYRCMDLTTDEDGNIYITDGMDYSIKKVDGNGQILAKSGRRGKGPGEFINPALIAFHGGYIYVSQQMMPGIQVFQSLDLSYVKTIPLSFNILSMEFYEDRMFATTMSFNSEATIAEIDYQKSASDNDEYIKTLRKIGQEIEKEEFTNFLMRSTRMDIGNQGNFFMCFMFQNKIEKCSPLFEKIWSRKTPIFSEETTEFTKIKKMNLPSKMFFKDIQFCNQHIILLGGHFSENKSQELYLFNKEGQYIKRLLLDEPTHFIHIDKNTLYTRGDMGSAIHLYALKW